MSSPSPSPSPSAAPPCSAAVTTSSNFLLYSVIAGLLFLGCTGYWARAYLLRRDKAQRDQERMGRQETISTHARQRRIEVEVAPVPFENPLRGGALEAAAAAAAA